MGVGREEGWFKTNKCELRVNLGRIKRIKDIKEMVFQIWDKRKCWKCIKCVWDGISGNIINIYPNIYIYIYIYLRHYTVPTHLPRTTYYLLPTTYYLLPTTYHIPLSECSAALDKIFWHVVATTISTGWGASNSIPGTNPPVPPVPPFLSTT